METLIALTMVHSNGQIERHIYSDDAFNRRRSAHRAMQASIAGKGVLWHRGKWTGTHFEGSSSVVYIPARTSHPRGVIS